MPMTVSTKKSRHARSVTVAAVVIGLSATLDGNAHADTNGHVFTKKDTTYSKSDANSQFDARVTWGSPGKPVAWSLVLSPALQAIAVSNMTCDAGVRNFPHYSAHKVAPVGYIWHSTIPGPHQMSQNWWYELSGRCTFRHDVNGGGTATVDFKFDYRFSNFDGSLTEKSTKNPLTEYSDYRSDVELQYN
ncbi:hypothetical protein GCM10017673_11280 [Streptosporangium violaceochromogenes]|nr:hypothetical protein GCM10017673_11280 [Streptosporangium violaceochromogenes]